jgi:hypothetical protein
MSSPNQVVEDSIAKDPARYYVRKSLLMAQGCLAEGGTAALGLGVLGTLVLPGAGTTIGVAVGGVLGCAHGLYSGNNQHEKWAKGEISDNKIMAETAGIVVSAGAGAIAGVVLKTEPGQRISAAIGGCVSNASANIAGQLIDEGKINNSMKAVQACAEGAAIGTIFTTLINKAPKNTAIENNSSPQQASIPKTYTKEELLKKLSHILSWKGESPEEKWNQPVDEKLYRNARSIFETLHGKMFDETAKIAEQAGKNNIAGIPLKVILQENLATELSFFPQDPKQATMRDILGAFNESIQRMNNSVQGYRQGLDENIDPDKISHVNNYAINLAEAANTLREHQLKLLTEFLK